MEIDNNLESHYNEGDFVVYPAHGVGQVLGLENQKVGDSYFDLVVVRFDQGECYENNNSIITNLFATNSPRR